MCQPGVQVLRLLVAGGRGVSGDLLRRLDRRFLGFGVERGDDRQPAAVDLLLGETLGLQLVLHHVEQKALGPPNCESRSTLGNSGSSA